MMNSYINVSLLILCVRVLYYRGFPDGLERLFGHGNYLYVICVWCNARL